MSAYFATLTDLERHAIMVGLLFGVAILTITFPVVVGLVKPSARFFRWMSYLAYTVIAAVATLLLWIPPATAPELSGFAWWDQQGVHVIFGLALLGLGYMLEDAVEEIMVHLGARPAPKHFRFWRWFTTPRGGTRSLLDELWPSKAEPKQ